MSLAEYNEKVDRLIQDDAVKLESAEIDAFILEALSYYSKDAPYVKVADIAGDGSYEYDLPSDWVEGFSIITSVEYPAGEQIPTYLETSDYGIYKTASTLKLRFYSYTPTASETIRISYSTLYTKATIDNIPTQDQDAFCNLAAALCCSALARIYSQTSDPTIDADSVNYRTKSGEYAQRVQELLLRYNNFMGKKDGSPQAAGAVRDWDTNYSWGEDLLIHSGRKR